MKPILSTRVEAAWLCDLSPRQFDDVIKPRLARKAIVGSGKKLRYNAQAVAIALAAYRVEQASIQLEAESIDGDHSISAERIRAARADLLEMERDSLRGQLIPRHQLEGPLAEFAMVLRNAGDTLVRKFGNDAAAILNDAVDEAEKGWQELAQIGDGDEDEDRPANAVAAGVDGGADPGAQAADDPAVRRTGDHSPDRTA